MKAIRVRLRHVALIGVLLLLLTSVALAQGGFDLAWWTVDAGGGAGATGDGYELAGAAGQPDAGLMAGGAYTLSGGFWGGAGDVLHKANYLPLVSRG